MSLRPEKITLRYYNVGFGDCVLLVFHYAAFERFVLLDCGTTSAPKKAPAGEHLLRVAKSIEARCGGGTPAGAKLHAVVATHRHKDHVEGFRRKANGKGAGDVLLGCKPDAVLLPWTEDPRLETDATRPSSSLTALALAARGLQGMQAAAGGVLAEARRLAPVLSKSAFRRLEFLGDDNLGNRNAMETLWEMGKRSPAGRCHFLHHGKPSTGLKDILPGVKVRVLGPPTIEQHAAVLKQRRSDEAEYWHLLGLAGARSSGTPQPFRGAERVGKPPPEHRWIVRQLERLRAQQLYEVVRTVDDALNNTSLILLFQVGKQKLLFPGDAQIENWEFALAKNAAALKDVSVYKVGHHGSLNATPKTLWNAFARKKTGSGKRDLVSVCSTKGGVHGHVNEVPRRKLVDELEKHSTYYETPPLSKRTKTGDKDLYGEIEIPVSG